MTDDPERMVAEALRAHAARTPLPEPEQADATRHTDETGTAHGGYGLLSGSEMARLAPATGDHPTVQVPRPPDRTSRLEPEPRVAVGWVVLLALLLGLAAGAVVGLLTLL
ncbi:MAG TPA: hypothetical protein VGP26_06330 [Actinophytocola sp.]|jgi:hypothetical protein|nr:hypothetical protein [Actinophytocola sp.]